MTGTKNAKGKRGKLVVKNPSKHTASRVLLSKNLVNTLSNKAPVFTCLIICVYVVYLVYSVFPWRMRPNLCYCEECYASLAIYVRRMWYSYVALIICDIKLLQYCDIILWYWWSEPTNGWFTGLWLGWAAGSLIPKIRPPAVRSLPPE
jgi:hypothetical protein